MLKLPTTPRIIALKKKEELLFFLGKLSLFLIITSIFIPFSPKLPAPGIDPSWALGLNQAVAQGLAFGKDIIFTLGPYSSLYTKAYHPATDSLMMAGCFYLAISYWFCLLFLMRKTRWLWFFMLCIPFLGMIYARDSLFFSYPLLTGLISHQIISHDRIQLSNSSLLSLVFLFLPLLVYSRLSRGQCLSFVFSYFFCALFFYHQ